MQTTSSMLKSKWTMVPFCLLLLAMLAGTPELWGQKEKAELSGVVTDPSGARVPQATVIAVHTATQFTREVQTNDSGFYVIGLLPIGDYSLSAESSGFRRYVQYGIRLNIGDRKVIDLVLEVGDVADQIEVTAAAPLVDRSDATIGEILETTTINALPLNGRDFTSLLKLQPGAVSGGGAAYPAGSVTGSANEPGDWAGVSYNGAHDSWSSSTYTLDGINVDIGFYGLLPANTVSLESIQEVAVETSNFSAESGSSAAGKVRYISKTGGNDFHGSFFEFYRGTTFQANEFLANASGQELEDFSRHQFGGSIGGPIVKDSLFFFFSYEGIRTERPTSRSLTLPTAAFKATLDPVIQQILGPLPTPANPDPLEPRQGQVTVNGQFTNDADVFMPRIDWNHGADQVFFRYNRYHSDKKDGAATQGALPEWPRLDDHDQDNIALGWTRLINPTTVNEFGFGWHYYTRGTHFFDGFPFPDCPGCGQVGVSGSWSRNDVPRNLDFWMDADSYALYDNFRFVKANHGFSAGFDFKRNRSVEGVAETPNYSFESLDQLAANAPQRATYNTFHKALSTPSIQFNYGFFFQDDWKVSPRLTLNLGVRYDFQLPLKNELGAAGRREELKDTAGGLLHNCKICTPGSFLVPGTQVLDPVNDPFFTRPGEKIENGDYNNVSPRLGVAYDLTGDGKTVLRGGFSNTYQIREPATFGGNRITGNSLGATTVNADDVPGGISFPITDFSNIGTTGAGAKRFTFIWPDIDNGWTRQWNANLQRVLPDGDTMLQVGYVANRTRVLSIFNSRYALNPFIPDPSNPAGGAYVDPCCTSIDARGLPEHTSYHSLQVSLRRSLARGLALQAFYTWGHSLHEYHDNQHGTFFNRHPDFTYPDGPGSQFDRIEKGASFGDVRHNFLTHFVWELPLGQHPVARGWQITGLFEARTGDALQLTSGLRNRFRGRSRPNAVLGVSPYSGSVGHDRPFLNKAAFAIPGADPDFPGLVQIGNLGRADLHGPSRWNTDVSLFKSITIHENHRVELRAEIFNLFNHTNWGHSRGGINTNLSSARFGFMETPASSSRQVQLGIRYAF
jgi:outer membrane receptor protein involved in Fe transport